MRPRLVPCWRCRRPTPAAALVETHIYAGRSVRVGWEHAADRVIWLCPGCAAPPPAPALVPPPPGPSRSAARSTSCPDPWGRR
jgi:hypothetical protein